MERALKFRYYLFVDKSFVFYDLKNSNGVTPDQHGYYGGISSPQQYTGLKDKNNKEIYDGDIVRYQSWRNEYDRIESEWTDEVKFKGGHWYPIPYSQYCDDGFYSYGIDKDSYEVIGNIFENPELINTK